MLSEAFVSQMPLRPIKFFNIIFGVFTLNGVEMCTKKGTKGPKWAKSGLSQNFVNRIFAHFMRRALKCARDNLNCIILRLVLFMCINDTRNDTGCVAVTYNLCDVRIT